MTDLGDGNYSFIVLVSDERKAAAIKAILKDRIEMGNIVITATVLDPSENETKIEDGISVYKIVFNGNPLFLNTVFIKFMGREYLNIVYLIVMLFSFEMMIFLIIMAISMVLLKTLQKKYLKNNC